MLNQVVKLLNVENRFALDQEVGLVKEVKLLDVDGNASYMPLSYMHSSCNSWFSNF